MITAMDADPSLLDMQEKAFVARIRQHGWTAMAIGWDKDGPCFDYTTGFWLNLGFPEIIVFGLPASTGNAVFWHMYKTLKSGKTFAVREPLDTIFVDVPGMLLPVAEEESRKHLTWTGWFYSRKNPFPCLQLVWPDGDGNFPWNPGYPEEMRPYQQDLTGGHWAGLQRH